MKNRAQAFIIAIMLTFIACDGPKPASDVNEESAIKGTITVPVDAEIIPMIFSISKVYSVDYPLAHVTFEPVTSGNAVRSLMGGLTKGIIIAREYLPDEDSAIKNTGQSFPRTQLAKDALVFYVNKAFPYDTMSSVHIVAWIKGTLSDVEMKRLYPKLDGQIPAFVVPTGSSVHSNVMRYTDGVAKTGRLTGLPTRDAIRKRVMSDQRSVIGVGYLSQFATDSAVKMLRLSYNDSSGTYQPPRVVHVANLIQSMYPFPVTIYFVLKDTPSQHSLTSGVMQYMSRDAKAQRIFFDFGIEPAYAKFELISPD